MTTYKKAGAGIVAQSFDCLATVQVGDSVGFTGDHTVGYVVDSPQIGEVVAKTPDGLRCTVELNGSKIETAIAEGAIGAAGALLKIGTARGKVRTANPVTTAADIPLVMGVAFAAAADGATVTFLRR